MSRLLFLASALAAAACSPAAAGVPSTADVSDYSRALDLCDADSMTRDQYTACHDAARAQFCARFPNAANCPASSSPQSRQCDQQREALALCSQREQAQRITDAPASSPSADGGPK